MKKLSISFVGFIVFGMLASAGYYFNEIRVARVQTAGLVAQAFTQHGQTLDTQSISKERKQILLAVEDPAFYRHKGVDLETPGGGMTTITQSIVKLLYFPEGFEKGLGKIRQTLIAQYALNDLVSKDEQLALFLNVAYFGEVDGQPVHGFDKASNAYFSAPYTAISDNQFLGLVSMLIAPNNLKPEKAESLQRLQKVSALIAGNLKPASVLDVDYSGKLKGTYGEEALMALLRLLVDAKPQAGAKH